MVISIPGSKSLTCLLLCLLVFLAVPAIASSPVHKNPIVIHANKHDVSPPLRDIPPSPEPFGIKRIIHNPVIPRASAQNAKQELDP
ncbi:MAG: hypothetical protein C5B54_08940, partial [Acidobacteria bacterium]